MSSDSRFAAQAGYVLHARPYRETSVLVEAFTRGRGRVGMVAKGARRPRSRLQGLLQPFRPLLFSWQGRGDLVTLTDAEADGLPIAMVGPVLMSGFYINELVLRLMQRHDPHAGLFQVYGATLQRLTVPGGQERALRIFEKHLLREIGYGLILDHDIDGGGPIREDTAYSYELERGPVPRTARKETGIVVHGSSLLSLEREELDDGNSLREVKHLLRAALALYLADKPLNSRRVYRQMIQAGSGGGPANAGEHIGD